MESTDRAKPLANPELTKHIFKLCEKATAANKLKRGANEATKALNRDIAEVIVLAADATPLEIVLHLPLLCEDKSVGYIFVPSMAELGQACGTSRNVVACAITSRPGDATLADEIQDAKVKIEKCYYEWA